MFRFGSRKANRQEYRCTVRLLDDDEPPINCDFQHVCLGQYVLDFVCSSIGLLEKDLFGLRYVDSHNQRRWLDLSKPVLKQVKDIRNVVFCFRVKFYPPNPLDLKEDSTRYQVYLQLKRDLSHGRLNCTQSEAALMVAYVKQAELGDHEAPSNQGDARASSESGDEAQSAFSARILPKHSQEIESRVDRIHETLKGVSATDAQDFFLKRAATLESYGIDPHPVKDEHNTQLYIGVNYLGVMTFRAGKRDLHIRFDDLVKFNYEGKMFILHVMTAGSNRKQVIGFRCPTQAACQYLFACANEIRCFYTSIPPLVSKKNTLSRAMSILKKRENSVASLAPSQMNLAPNNLNFNKSGLSDHREDNCKTEVRGASDIDSLMAHSEDEDELKGQLKTPLITPTVDATPTKQNSKENGDVFQSTNVYGPVDSPIAEHPEYTILECQSSSSILRHAQMLAFTALVMLLIISVTAIAVMESDSALFEEVKSWPPLVILRREYYHPVKSFISGRMSFDY
ncbi:FERM domain-containing protein 3 [Galendromus occidentalis]|uniref:Moesin/ezrin/radixin homolog 1 n=1 Tax=Galendromus occidentalis TaxID=34638 RepID=A0AAJ7SDB8_9ACAR|nr:FERM domain-containing protein 3 [Galendromus occidentalis]